MLASEENLQEYLKENQVKLPRKSTFFQGVTLPNDEEGNIVLKDKDYHDSKINTDLFNFCKKWIVLKNTTMALVKNRIPDGVNGDYSNWEKEVLVSNNFILPEIAKQFQLQTAEYYNVKFDTKSDKEFSKNQVYILTPSFLKPGQELEHYANIVGEDEFKVSKMLPKIENWLRLRKYPETDIERIKTDFIKQTIFDRYIEFTDEHNLNGGIITDGKRAELSPSYDLDFSCGVYNSSGWKPIVFSRVADDEEMELSSIIMQYKDLPWMQQYLKEVIEGINIDEALKKASEDGNIELSEKAVKHYKRFFEFQNKELHSAYEQAYGKQIEER